MFTRSLFSFSPPDCYAFAMGKRILIVDDEPDFSELVQ
jgi:hypothetical protein